MILGEKTDTAMFFLHAIYIAVLKIKGKDDLGGFGEHHSSIIEAIL